MSNLKKFKKQKKQLKREIKATKAHLALLENELKELYQVQQHRVIDNDLERLLEQSSPGPATLLNRLISIMKPGKN